MELVFQSSYEEAKRDSERAEDKVKTKINTKHVDVESILILDSSLLLHLFVVISYYNNYF